MSEFDLGYYNDEAAELALEIERKLVILGLNWNDAATMRSLAKEILGVNKAGRQIGTGAEFSRDQTYEELFGLIALMNKLMAEGAEKGVEIHGNAAWKAVAKALWLEKSESDGAA